MTAPTWTPNDRKIAGYTKPVYWLVCAIFASICGQAGADERLLALLRDKGVISADEFRTLKADGRQRPLVDLLISKGVISSEEAINLRNSETSDATVRQAVATDHGAIAALKSGKYQVELNGRLHADYRSYDIPVAGVRNTFEVRRARLGANVFIGDYYEMEVTGDFSEEGASLDTGFANFSWVKPAQLRAGKFKMPFSLEEMTSSNYIDFQERSLVNNLVPGKLTGIMLHGRPATGVYYGLALSNGAEDIETDNNNVKDVIGRLTLNAAEWLGLSKSIVHAGFAATHGALPEGGVAFSARTEGRGLKFFKVDKFTGGETDYSRLGLELVLAHGPVKLQGEYVGVGFEGTNHSGAMYNRTMSAWYTGVSWMVTGENYASSYKNGSFSRIRPNAEFAAGHGLGAWELGLRYSRFDASEFASGNTLGTGVLKGGYANTASAWTFGLKWIPSEYARLMVNVVRTSFGTPVAVVGNKPVNSELAIMLRTQLNF